MDLKEKIEKRKQERKTETADAFKQDLDTYAREKKQKELKERAAREHILRSALDVITGTISIQNDPESQTLSLQSAHQIIDEELKNSQSIWFGLAALFSLVLAVYIGVSYSWGTAIFLACSVLVIGELISRLIGKEKKKQLIEQHLKAYKGLDT